MGESAPIHKPFYSPITSSSLLYIKIITFLAFSCTITFLFCNASLPYLYKGTALTLQAWRFKNKTKPNPQTTFLYNAFLLILSSRLSSQALAPKPTKNAFVMLIVHFHVARSSSWFSVIILLDMMYQLYGDMVTHSPILSLPGLQNITFLILLQAQ